MPNPFASGRRAIAECDRCGFRYKLKQLKNITIKTKSTNILVCPTCWEKDQPQLQIGMYPINDPQALRNPRPDVSFWQAGMTGVKELIRGEVPSSSSLAFGSPSEGSRIIQWGWAPVGLNNALALPNLPNTLLATASVGMVTIEI